LGFGVGVRVRVGVRGYHVIGEGIAGENVTLHVSREPLNERLEESP
jgi:hypothetical protein